ncbi:hypothetical protein BRADI_4g36351v3 [Brachypodium distachyon]|uniref:F-box domain-containing protein n=1 Tax=Brachypodium distachyon TaxID=15368 RepID=A0A0Q3EUQ4_BRADI|nr:hypothetical protein BRADI_4g36351v3 [Brachypodium distachyon]
MASLRESSNAREIPIEILQEILLKLPTKDVARCCCVSRPWRAAVADPTFRDLHAASSAVASMADAAEVLLVSETEKSEPGRNGDHTEASIFNVASGNAMCHVAVPRPYRLANVCHGFLCFVHCAGAKAPAVNDGHLFALGFSPATPRVYKLFRLSFPSYSYSSRKLVHMDVYTLAPSDHQPGGGVGTESWPPALIDGKLHVMTAGWNLRHQGSDNTPKRIFVIDVRTETCRTYRLPDCSEATAYKKELVATFELDGRLCFAAHILSRDFLMFIHFWVRTPSAPADQDKDVNGGNKRPPCWELLYRFEIEGPICADRPWGVCSPTPLTSDQGRRPVLMRWDQRLQLPDTRLFPSERRWNICRGYRPSLLSPLTFAFPPPSEEDGRVNGHRFEHALLRVLRCNGGISTKEESNER